MTTAAERLEKARIAAGYRSAAAFARAVDVHESTYRSHENGTRPLTIDAAKIYAPKLAIPWNVLYFGDDAPPIPADPPAPQEDHKLNEIAPNPAPSLSPVTAPDYENAVGSPFRPVQPLPSEPLARDIQVKGVGAANSRGEYQLVEGPIDHVRRPPGIPAAQGVYAIYVVGDSMLPRYEAGDPVYVSELRAVEVNDHVLIQIHEEHGEARAMIKQLIKRTETKIVLKQHNPPRTIEIARAPNVVLHRIYTNKELFGL